MKAARFVLVLGTFIIAALFFSACNKNEPTSPSALSKSSKIMLKASSKSALSGNPGNIPVSGGSISLSSFNVNLSKIQIQENSGFNGEQQGDNNDGGTDGGGSETETPDIILNGPFNLNIASGSVDVGSFDVYPGTFKQVDLYFTASLNQPYNGNSIIINGDFTNQAGTSIPVILKSGFDHNFQTLISNNGITVTQNTTVPVTIVFDFNKLFTNLNISSAIVTNGAILIDDTHNPQLLKAFENNLNNSVELENER